MPGERIRRQIDALLDEADAAMARLQWDVVRERALAVLAADPANQDARDYLSAAQRGLAAAFSRSPRPAGHFTGAPPPATPRATSAAYWSALAPSRPGYTARPVPAGNITLMFSDIEASTSANERLGDERWLDVLRAHNAIVEGQVRRHGGRVIKTMGDGYMVAFLNPRDGVRCGLAVQHALGLAEHRDLDRDGMRVRIGLHSGLAVRHGDDFVGREVTYAARVASAADGGEVLVSAELQQRLCDLFAFGQPRDVAFKGFEGIQVFFPVEQETPPPA